ncbi:MAG: hypothetical protein J5701_01525 [Bacteroidales bacterium]|nr:hypothetical protein [Bacteroidales bacterium]
MGRTIIVLAIVISIFLIIPLFLFLIRSLNNANAFNKKGKTPYEAECIDAWENFKLAKGEKSFIVRYMKYAWQMNKNFMYL